jgi:2-dehydropantoate 2-reductase
MRADADSPDAVEYIPATAVSQAEEVERCDLVLLAVKSFNTLAAVQGAQHLITRTSPVVTLQTGLGNIEQLERIVGRENIIGGFTFMAATALGSSIVRQGGSGKTYLGELDGRISTRLQTICTAFSDSGLKCTPVHRIVGRLWCKVIVFSAINVVTSVLQVKNGQLLDSMESITLLKRLIDEGRMVAQKQAVDLVFPDLYQLLFDACRKTDQNLSSMLQDILAGKQTELNAQCGALVQLGEQTGIATPTQQTMLELVQLVSKKQQP